jgi:cytochrome c-type biogenesis protein CcmF
MAIWIALGLNVLMGGTFFLVARGRESLRSLAVRSYYALVLFAGLAVINLYYLIFTDNFAFSYIYQYSESAQPFFYKLSGFWGGQEGTYLLWLIFSSLFGFMILRRGGNYSNYGMAVYSVVNLFLLVLLVKLSPFALMPEVAPDGLGLNPLLRDPWMVIHPPIMFIGFALAAVPFAIAMAAMIRNDYTDWVKRAFPWVAMAALFLAAGNILGGYWAYKTLGWGGYWAWDPVENTSMVPWAVSLALLHGLIIERRTGALRKTNLLLSSLLFLLVIYGTFLTRSGVLADFSVHSFVDLGINANLVFFMGVFAVGIIGTFLWRARSIPSVPLNYNYFGKEFSLFASLAVLFIFALIVLFWSSLPILSGWFSDEPRAAEIATYNRFAIPLAILMAFLMTMEPLVKYGTYVPDNLGKRAGIVFIVAAAIGFGMFYFALSASLVFAIMFTLVVSGVVIYLLNPEFRKPLIPALIVFVLTIVVSLLAGVENHLFVLFYATAAMAATSNLIHLAGFIPDRLKFISAPLTHFGFGLMLVGIMASSAFDSSERLTIEKGMTAQSEAYGVQVAYNGMVNELDHPNNELLLALDDGSGPREVRPQLFYSQRMDGLMRRPYISRSLGYDLYLAPQQIQEGEGPQGMVLRKGESVERGGLTFTFAEFEVGGHDDMGESGMSVAANLTVARGDEIQWIHPKVIQVHDEHGHASVVDEPASFNFGDSYYEATILQIMADQGMVVLDVPGLVMASSPDRLILDVSKKPMISLVWVGTTLLLLGSIASVYRRRSELVRTDK